MAGLSSFQVPENGPSASQGLLTAEIARVTQSKQLLSPNARNRLLIQVNLVTSDLARDYGEVR